MKKVTNYGLTLLLSYGLTVFLLCATLAAQAQGLLFHIPTEKFYLDINENGAYDVGTDLEYTDQSGNWSYSGDILNLNGFVWETPAATALTIIGGNLTINLATGSTNRFTSTNTTEVTTMGIYSLSVTGITLMGTGALHATGGSTAGDYSCGISTGWMTVNGATLVATGGSSNGMSYGIICTGSTINKLTVNSGVVNATGGQVEDPINQSVSDGISADIEINGGTVTATGGDAVGAIASSCGFFGENILITDGTVYATGGTATDNRWNGAASSAGIWAQNKNMTITGGNVTATGSTAIGGVTDPGYGYARSFGLFVNLTGTLSITGGTVNATAGTVTAINREESYGISTNDNDIFITGGVTTAKGYSQAILQSISISSLGGDFFLPDYYNWEASLNYSGTTPATGTFPGTAFVNNSSYLFVKIAAQSPTPPSTAPIFYVDYTKSGDGSSWANAYPNLADPLILAAKQRSGAIAVAPTDTIRAIYVAQGTYYPMYDAKDYHFVNQVFPETNGERDNAFILVPGVKIYGGFAAPFPAAGVVPNFGSTGRNGVTTLSGDIDQNGILDNGNAYHVILGVNIPASSNTIIDGVTISGGNARLTTNILVNGILFYRSMGGGMYNSLSSPILTNVTIVENSTISGGGGMSNNNSSPTLTNVTIYGNHADHGGGMSNNSSSPILTNVTISGNSVGGDGGGMFNHTGSSPTLTNVTISGNSAEFDGGGMFNHNNSFPTLTNVTISGNRTTIRGGGIRSHASSSPIINNSIIYGNTAGTEGDNVWNTNSSTPAFAYSLIEGSGGSASWNAADFGIDNGNNIDDNPLFVAPVAASSAPTTAGNYRLQLGSPAIDAGSNALLPAGVTTDLAGNPRTFNGTVDMGAFENQNATPTVCPPQIYDAINHITYNVVELAGRCWLKENLRNTKYTDGTDIPFVEPYFSSLYPNVAQNEDNFGLLYDCESAFPATTSICPAGWHIPTSLEWELLKGFNTRSLKNPDYWSKPNDYTNSTHFDARGAGIYNSKTQDFEKLYAYTAYWAAGINMPGAKTGIGIVLYDNTNNCCSSIGIHHILKTDAISVRCIKD